MPATNRPPIFTLERRPRASRTVPARDFEEEAREREPEPEPVQRQAYDPRDYDRPEPEPERPRYPRAEYIQPEPEIISPKRKKRAGRGFAQTFGLHPATVMLITAVNTMVFITGLGSGGVGWALSTPIGVVLGVITFLAQKRWYGDEQEDALLKALIVTFLTAIPSSLPGYLTVPGGAIGLFRGGKNQEED